MQKFFDRLWNDLQLLAIQDERIESVEILVNFGAAKNDRHGKKQQFSHWRTTLEEGLLANYFNNVYRPEEEESPRHTEDCACEGQFRQVRLQQLEGAWRLARTKVAVTQFEPLLFLPELLQSRNEHLSEWGQYRLYHARVQSDGDRNPSHRDAVLDEANIHRLQPGNEL